MSVFRAITLTPSKPLDERRLLRVFGICVLLGSAVLLGRMIALEQWLALAAICALPLALQWPIEIALGAYAFLIPFEYIFIVGQGRSGLTLLGIGATAVMFATGIIRKSLSWPPRAALFWAASVFWAVLSIIWAIKPEETVTMIPTAVFLFLLYLVGVSWNISEKQFALLTRFLVLGSVLASCFLIYQYVHGVTYRNSMLAIGRGSLMMGNYRENPNAFGAELLLPFSLALAEFMSARRALHVLWGIIATAALGGAAFLTMSRGALLAVVLIVVIFLFRTGLKRRLLAVAFALLAILALMPASFFYRLQIALSTGGAGRLEIWHATFFAFQKYWFMGAGLNNFPAAYSEFAGYAPSFVGFGRGAHNIFLEAAVEFGVLGLLLMCAALGYHLRAVRKLRHSVGMVSNWGLALECAGWATLIDGFFEGGAWHKSFWFTWMLCLMAARLCRGSQDSQRASAPVDEI